MAMSAQPDEDEGDFTLEEYIPQNSQFNVSI